MPFGKGPIMCLYDEKANESRLFFNRFTIGNGPRLYGAVYALSSWYGGIRSQEGWWDVSMKGIEILRPSGLPQYKRLTRRTDLIERAAALRSRLYSVFKARGMHEKGMAG